MGVRWGLVLLTVDYWRRLLFGGLEGVFKERMQGRMLCYFY